MRRFDLFPGGLPIIRVVACVGLLWFIPDTARSQEDSRIQIFQLRWASADEVGKVLQTFLPAEATGAVVEVDARANSIIVVGSDEVLAQIQSLIQLLDGEPDPRLIRIFPLSNRSAEEAAELLTEVLTDDPRVGNVSIVADSVADSLIVRSTREDSEYVEELLQVIDVQQAPNIKVFALSNAIALETGEILNAVWNGAAQFAVDERTNSVIATGQAEVLAEVEALLMRLDAVEQQPVNLDQLQVRVIWIVSAGDEERVQALPADLTDVAAELNSLGISQPSIAAQMVVRSSGRFSVSGSASLENPCQIEVAGSIQAENARPTLEISIVVQEESETQVRTLSDVETILTAPIGHFVVLGISPIGSRNSAFVVQLSPGPQ